MVYVSFSDFSSSYLIQLKHEYIHVHVHVYVILYLIREMLPAFQITTQSVPILFRLQRHWALKSSNEIFRISEVLNTTYNPQGISACAFTISSINSLLFIILYEKTCLNMSSYTFNFGSLWDTFQWYLSIRRGQGVSTWQSPGSDPWQSKCIRA